MADHVQPGHGGVRAADDDQSCAGYSRLMAWASAKISKRFSVVTDMPTRSAS
ncbi:MAG: hypothetical protein MZV64_28815 [Ignavibacteriales bacterium]|nr:hypothetical protein [Ignavibacteriales bacterium]